MCHDGQLVTGVADSLVEPDIGIAGLSELALKVYVGEIAHHHVRAIGAAGKLLPAPRVEAMVAENGRKLALAALALLITVHFLYLWKLSHSVPTGILISCSHGDLSNIHCSSSLTSLSLSSTISS